MLTTSKINPDALCRRIDPVANGKPITAKQRRTVQKFVGALPDVLTKKSIMQAGSRRRSKPSTVLLFMSRVTSFCVPSH
jgi:hypothetical protein